MIKFKFNKTSPLKGCPTTEGEHIENKIRRLVEDKEPIGDTAPMIYTEKKDGVIPGYDIRTDRFDVALDAMELMNKAHIARREEGFKPEEKKEEKPAEPTAQSETQATEAESK